MGVKAVFGPSIGPEAVMGFAASSADANSVAFFSHAKKVAEASLATPYYITIGGGDGVGSEYRGRAIELARSTGVYGETEVFVKDKNLRERLKRWPTAVVLTEVYTIKKMPHLVNDLSFSNLKILSSAFDGVRKEF